MSDKLFCPVHGLVGSGYVCVPADLQLAQNPYAMVEPVLGLGTSSTSFRLAEGVVQEVRSVNAPEPPPTKNEHPAVWPLVMQDFDQTYRSSLDPSVHQVLEDMAERNASGIAKYGIPLTPWNGRDCLIDYYQECLDSVAYARQAVAEYGTRDTSLCRELCSLYYGALQQVLSVRRMLDRRRA